MNERIRLRLMQEGAPVGISFLSKVKPFLYYIVKRQKED
jgi:hypothetical protein